MHRFPNLGSPCPSISTQDQATRLTAQHHLTIRRLHRPGRCIFKLPLWPLGHQPRHISTCKYPWMFTCCRHFPLLGPCASELLRSASSLTRILEHEVVFRQGKLTLRLFPALGSSWKCRGKTQRVQAPVQRTIWRILQLQEIEKFFTFGQLEGMDRFICALICITCAGTEACEVYKEDWNDAIFTGFWQETAHSRKDPILSSSTITKPHNDVHSICNPPY